MFAVIKTGGKQYKVAKNDVIKVEKLSKTNIAVEGDIVVLEDVLAINDGKKTTIGTPLVKDATVSAEVIEQKKDDKVIIFKKRRRHNYRRKVGHRQEVVFLRITDIGGKAPAKKAVTKKAAPKTEAKKAPAKKAAPKKTDAKKTEDK